MTFVGYDICHIMMFVAYDVFECVAYRVCHSASYGDTRFFEPFACFFLAKERKSDSLTKKSESLLSLFCHQRPERVAHGCSFVMSDLSESLMVPLL